MLADSLYISHQPRCAIGSLLRDGSGELSFNHNLYADNYNGSPRLGDNLSLDFVNNVIYDWGTNAGFSANDSANNPGGFTNYLNYICNYLIASSNAVMNNIAFFGGSTNTWIFQTNNFIDSNTNGILDGANTKWNMFTNQFTEVGHTFPLIPVPTDEAYLAYEKVLDFAGVDLSQRDSVDAEHRRQCPHPDRQLYLHSAAGGHGCLVARRGQCLGQCRQPTMGLGWAPPVTPMAKWAQAFNFNGPPGASHIEVPDAPDLDFTNTMTVEAWVNVRTYAGPAKRLRNRLQTRRGQPSSTGASLHFLHRCVFYARNLPTS